MKNRPLPSLILVTVLLLFARCSGNKADTGGQDASASTPKKQNAGYVIRKADLKTSRVDKQSIRQTRTVSGRIIPESSTQIFAKVQGKITSGGSRFKAGNSFRKGETLLTIDSKEFALGLEAQKSSFLNIITGIMPDMKADYPDSYPQWQKYVADYSFHSPLPDLPPVKSPAEKYFVTSNQVYSTYYGIKAQEERLSKYRIQAPFDGTITKSMVDQGGMVSPMQPLCLFISSNRYEVEAAVDLATATRLKKGDTVFFHTPALEGRFLARVIRINNIIDPQTQNIPVFFSIQGPYIKSGIYVEGQIQSKAYEEATVIASDLVLRDQKVLVLDKDIIKKKAVNILDTKADSVIVSGLAQNDLLVLNKFEVPVEGIKIQ